MDMSKYMGIFRAESEKYIKELSDSLLALENDPENTEQMNTLFRAAHTFKGMAATMGFKQIVELTHEMESLIDRLRTRQIVLNSSLIDVLFVCVDTLEGLVESACEGEGNEPGKREKDASNKYKSYPDVSEVLKTLRKVNESPEKASIKKVEDNCLSAKSEMEDKEINRINKATKEVYRPEKEEKTLVPPKPVPKVKTIQSSRISNEQLDKLMNLVGEIVINRSRINELTCNLKSKELEAALSDLYKLTRELQNEVIEARMVPLDHITYVYPRMVRDLARVQNKKIDFIIKGKEIKLDRTILEEISDSLVHLLRNAVDHGIETPERRVELGKKENGTVLVTASRQENFALIKIEDDGCGIDTNEIRKVALKKGIISRESAEQLQEMEAMQLIFALGLSTSDSITDISGRGIGMNVVKNIVERLGGSIKVESKPGFGSIFELKLPLTIAVYQSMLIRVGNEKYAIPFTSIVKNIEVSSQEIKHIKGQEVVLIDNKILPLFRLRRQFQLSDQGDENNNFVVVVEKYNQYIGIVVDELLGKQEVIVKSFKSKLLDNTRGFAGATILGDGNVILIIDVNSLI
ncbi:chemotaxis protein CheA [Methanosarcina sp. UBA411]|jgi:two-component system chemotaxis sensor kinase CheA|uniref:chemotaxis protein CheA n=1 Tax=Methanosarcina sp. UBA411 TaxID=1915589 RepID=UPI0025D68A24|nr:chemotaxis protein CheA [Methanosarcina sp. UBA411]